MFITFSKPMRMMLSHIVHAMKEIDENNITFALTANQHQQIYNRFMHKASEFEKETRTLLSDPNSMRSCLGKIEVEDQGGFQIIVI